MEFKVYHLLEIRRQVHSVNITRMEFKVCAVNDVSRFICGVNTTRMEFKEKLSFCESFEGQCKYNQNGI